MCGIFAASLQQQVANQLLSGLESLEYRGYDSAGMAVLNAAGQLQLVRVAGKVANLRQRLAEQGLHGQLGIAHTRWATHGGATQANAHPHLYQGLAMVHNGIIEQQALLAQAPELAQQPWLSDTDSERLLRWLALGWRQASDKLLYLQQQLASVQGQYSLVLIDQQQPDCLWAARSGSPLVLGRSEQGAYLASDSQALQPWCHERALLDEGAVLQLQGQEWQLRDAQGQQQEPKWQGFSQQQQRVDRNGYAHYMHQEIHQQPEVLASSWQQLMTNGKPRLERLGSGAEQLLKQVKEVQILACGSSHHAALIAKYWYEAHLQLPVRVEIASEYRYRQSVCQADTLLMVISQSGETADTLAALRHARQQGYLASLGICNQAESSLAQEVDYLLLTQAGPEISVASTKALLCQLQALAWLQLAFAYVRQAPNWQHWADQLDALPESISHSLSHEQQIRQWALDLPLLPCCLVLGRGPSYPLAQEAALKLQEICYRPVLAFAGGELKHGPLALLEPGMVVIVLAGEPHLANKTAANIAEVQARGAEVWLLSEGQLPVIANRQLNLAEQDPWLAPLRLLPLVQLLAYHRALSQGELIDQPRNLAKSVTVE